MNNEQFTAVVPAAGVGSRMAADRPKQYLELLGRTVLEQTIKRLISHPNINKIVLVISPEDAYLKTLAIAHEPWLQVAWGGEERSDSVLNGLQVCEEDWVLVHDAARPCVRHEDISKLLALKVSAVGGILAKQATDTIKMAKNSNLATENLVENSIPRERIWQALTPQFFPRLVLIDAIKWCVNQGVTITDEASAIEQTGGKVRLIAGAYDNIKITHPGDLALAQLFLEQQQLNNTGVLCE